MMLSVGLTSLVTGITEPIEYSFLFIAPLLYVIHAVLTGVSMAVSWGLGVKDGFSFSAGLIDYVINWSLATKPWMIIPIGAVLRRRLLRGVPLRDHQVQPADAGAGAGGGRAGEGEHQGVAPASPHLSRLWPVRKAPGPLVRGPSHVVRRAFRGR